MKRFLLQGLLLFTAVIPALAEYVKPNGVSFYVTTDDWKFRYEVISEEEKTVSLTDCELQSLPNGTFIVPSIATRIVWNERNQQNDSVSYRVVQWEGGGLSTNGVETCCTIPETLDVIVGNVLMNSTLSKVTIEPGHKPLLIYPYPYPRGINEMGYNSLLKTLEIDRSIKVGDRIVRDAGQDENDYNSNTWGGRSTLCRFK